MKLLHLLSLEQPPMAALRSLVVSLTLLASFSLASKWPEHPTKHFSYAIVPGIFIQQDLATNASAAGPLPPRFGLVDDSPKRWKTLQQKVKALQKEGRKNGKVLYKVVFAGRHGQGYHNLAESKYGTPAWNDYWSKLNGDGEIVWGPDPALTPLGETQAQTVNALWHSEREYKIPVPQSLYSSPLTRAANTSRITFEGIVKNSQEPLIVENIREVAGIHTCDKRNTRSWIKKTFVDAPSSSKSSKSATVLFEIEKGLTEQDEIWQADVRETDAQVDVRSRDVLDRIFESDDETWISITSHGGFIGSLLRVVGHRTYSLPTGGVIPIVIKATPLK